MLGLSLCLCVQYVHIDAGTCGGQKGAWNLLELGRSEGMTWVLRTELGSPARAEFALNYWAIFPTGNHLL